MNDIIPGVLLLSDKIYGKHKNKTLYRCIPYNRKKYPDYLICYQVKKLGFNKKEIDKYILFKHLEDGDGHPIGVIFNTLGNVNELVNYYEYQLYCKEINHSIKELNHITNKQIANYRGEDLREKYNLENREGIYVFSIDPEGSKDFDDAVSIIKLDDKKYKVSIYISNVQVWLEEYNLWDYLSKRVSTIYLPDKKRVMLPTRLSDNICSLLENNARIAFTLDLLIEDNNINMISFCNSAIKVKKNYIYESSELLQNEQYQMLYRVVKGLNQNEKYISDIKDSHDVVAYLMILMNYHSSIKLIENKNGIYRKITADQNYNNSEISDFLKMWNSSGSSYTLYQNNIKHDILGLDSYVHITSPIRRLVDLLNLIQIQNNLGLIEMNGKVKEFYEKNIKNLDYINDSMKKIRKIQNESKMLEYFTDNKEELIKIYKGHIISNNGKDYTVYLPELKMVNQYVNIAELPLYSVHDFKLFYFSDNSNYKRKIRLHLI